MLAGDIAVAVVCAIAAECAGYGGTRGLLVGEWVGWEKGRVLQVVGACCEKTVAWLLWFDRSLVVVLVAVVLVLVVVAFILVGIREVSVISYQNYCDK